MKKRILAAIGIAVISIVSSALIAYLKDPKNYTKVKKLIKRKAKEYKL